MGCKSRPLQSSSGEGWRSSRLGARADGGGPRTLVGRGRDAGAVTAAGSHTFVYTPRMRKTLAAFLVVFCTVTLAAQKKDTGKPPAPEKPKDPAAAINKPRSDGRKVTFETTRGDLDLGRRLARRPHARLRPARRHLHAADRRRRGARDQPRAGVRPPAALLARRHDDRVHSGRRRHGEPLADGRRREESAGADRERTRTCAAPRGRRTATTSWPERRTASAPASRPSSSGCTTGTAAPASS